VKLSPKQGKILRYDYQVRPKITILEGAVRSGKTVINNGMFYNMVRANTGACHDYIITGHTIGSITRNVLKPLSEDFGINTKLSTFNTFEMYGNLVNCFGTDKADSYKVITGMTAYGWLGNEITLSHSNSIQECFNRCSGEGARIYWDTNPDYPAHPVKADYIDRSGEKLESGAEHIKAWHFEIDDNPFLPPEYVESLKMNTPEGMWYDRKIKGLWVAAEGLVFELFNHNVHVIDPFDIPTEWLRYRAIDFGFRNPFVCLWGAVDGDGRLFIYDEHYEREKLLKYHAEQIKKRPGRFSCTVTDHDPQDVAELRTHGIVCSNANKSAEIGREKVAQRLTVQGDGKPRLFITSNCVNMISEFGRYVWEPQRDGKSAKEEPVKDNDHAMDALRYMIMHLDKSGFYMPKFDRNKLGI